MIEKRKFNDEDIESIMGLLLRIGVIISASVVLVGGFIYLWRHGYEYPNYKEFKGEPEDLTNIIEILHGVRALHGRAIIQSGLLILIATPIARILLSIIGFLLEKDYRYVFISLLVLAIIVYSLLSGTAG